MRVETQVLVLVSLVPPSATRQACSVYLKNRVHTSYIIDSSRQCLEQIPIAPSDRDALKANILHLLAQSPSRAITVQLAATLKDLIVHDFPDNWSNLLQEVIKLLTSRSRQEVSAGCVAALSDSPFHDDSLTHRIEKRCKMIHDERNI